LRRGRAIPIAALALVLAAVPARAELNQRGPLVVGFDGGLAPTRLPRQRAAPIAVRVAGDIRVTKGARLPQVRRISVAINRAGRLDDRGLPTCGVRSIQPATEAEARRVCARAIVGTGHVVVQAAVPGQPPFTVKATLLAFNGPTTHGQKQILAEVYSTDPPGSFILTFRLRHRRGAFGTVLTTTLPRKAWGWAYLTHFEMTLHRVYRYHGAVHSYVSAACSAPAGFPGAVFPFAKATYGFGDGQAITITAVRSCRVAGP
jgi:hypothetical protein